MFVQVKYNGVRALGNLFASVGAEQLSRLTKLVQYVTHILLCYLFGFRDL